MKTICSLASSCVDGCACVRSILCKEKAMVVSLSSLMNDSVPDRVEAAKFNLLPDSLLLLDLAHGPTTAAGRSIWTEMQNFALGRGAVHHVHFDCVLFLLVGEGGGELRGVEVGGGELRGVEVRGGGLRGGR